MKPILFNTSMVQAILNGTKTQTRRPISEDQRGEWVAVNDVRKNSEWDATVPCYLHREISVDDKSRNIMYPKYDVGDILYVRETWMASEHGYFIKNAIPYLIGKLKWRPSIHMPKEAARLFLKVTDVKVERLNDISNDDVSKEGFNEDVYFCPIEGFSEIWDNIYAKRGLEWNFNPWVWVITFEKIEKPEVINNAEI